MDIEDKRKVMDSLTPDQRIGISEIIKDADIEGDYNWNGEDSVWTADASLTLRELARFFELYDPDSVLD